MGCELTPPGIRSNLRTNHYILATNIYVSSFPSGTARVGKYGGVENNMLNHEYNCTERSVDVRRRGVQLYSITGSGDTNDEAGATINEPSGDFVPIRHTDIL